METQVSYVINAAIIILIIITLFVNCYQNDFYYNFSKLFKGGPVYVKQKNKFVVLGRLNTQRLEIPKCYTRNT